MNIMKKMHKLFVVMIATCIFGSLAITSAYAVINNVDSSDIINNTSNSLSILMYPETTRFTYETNIDDSRLTVYDKGADAPQTIPFIQNYTTNNYSSYVAGYKAHSFIINSYQPGDYITTYHGSAGLYDGRVVDIKVTYSNFVYKNRLGGQGALANSTLLDVSENPYSGFFYWNLDNMQITMTAYYNDTGEEVDLTDSFLTINSHNGYDYGYPSGRGREFSKYLNSDAEDSNSQVYLSNDTNIVYGTLDVTKSAYTDKVFYGANDNFDDFLGADTFTRNSVTYQLTGTNQKFVVGSEFGSGWQSFNSGLLFYTYADKPIKTASNKIVNFGDEFSYTITQKVQTLGVNLLTRYDSMVFVDQLPAEVEYIDAKLVAEDGTDLTDKGTLMYDPVSHTLTFEMGNDYLKNDMAYIGESYSLEVTVRVNDNITEETTITNTAEVYINQSYVQVTNTVIVSVVETVIDDDETKVTDNQTETVIDDDETKVTDGQTETVIDDDETKVTDGQTETVINDETKVTDNQIETVNNNVKTGDGTPIVWLIIIWSVALIGLNSLIIGKKVYHKRKN